MSTRRPSARNPARTRSDARRPTGPRPVTEQVHALHGGTGGLAVRGAGTRNGCRGEIEAGVHVEVHVTGGPDVGPEPRGQAAQVGGVTHESPGARGSARGGTRPSGRSTRARPARMRAPVTAGRRTRPPRPAIRASLREMTTPARSPPFAAPGNAADPARPVRGRSHRQSRSSAGRLWPRSEVESQGHKGSRQTPPLGDPRNSTERVSRSSDPSPLTKVRNLAFRAAAYLVASTVASWSSTGVTGSGN